MFGKNIVNINIKKTRIEDFIKSGTREVVENTGCVCAFPRGTVSTRFESHGSFGYGPKYRQLEARNTDSSTDVSVVVSFNTIKKIIPFS